MNEILIEEFVPKINYQICRKCTKNWRIPPFITHDYDLTYVFKGSARYTIDGTPYSIKSGDVLFLPRGVEKEAVTAPSDPMHCFAVNFIPKYPPEKAVSLNFPLVSHIGLREDLIDLFNELTFCWAMRQTGSIIKTRALLMLILQRLAEIITGGQEIMVSDWRISKIIRFISLHYADKLTVQGLADSLSLNADYFSRLFRQQVGTKVQRYIAQIRVRNAENLLQSGEFKVYDVASLCGFSDIYHFHKTFKELRGLSPSKCIPKREKH